MIRVIHVVPFLSDDMRFGGPVRVALNIATEQQNRGTLVQIAGAGDSTHKIHMGESAGTCLQARAFRSKALWKSKPFTSRVSPALWRWVARKPDPSTIIHLHMGRDPVSLAVGVIAAVLKLPLITQTHGMIERRTGPITVLDRVVVRPILKAARHTLALTDSEAAYLRALTSVSTITVFPNGTSVPPERPKPHAPTRVLFLARLHPRKGAAQFARVACRLSSRHPSSELAFRIAGPDEGALTDVLEIIDSSPSVTYIGPQTPDQALMEMEASHIYVLPAPNEPFGMTVLEALSTRNAVVLCESAALAPGLVGAHAALTFDGSDESLLEVLESLILDHTRRDSLGERGRDVVMEKFSIGANVTKLENIYSSAMKVARG